MINGLWAIETTLLFYNGTSKKSRLPGPGSQHNKSNNTSHTVWQDDYSNSLFYMWQGYCEQMGNVFEFTPSWFFWRVRVDLFWFFYVWPYDCIVIVCDNVTVTCTLRREETQENKERAGRKMKFVKKTHVYSS